LGLLQQSTFLDHVQQSTIDYCSKSAHRFLGLLQQSTFLDHVQQSAIDYCSKSAPQDVSAPLLNNQLIESEHYDVQTLRQSTAALLTDNNSILVVLLSTLQVVGIIDNCQYLWHINNYSATTVGFLFVGGLMDE